MTGDPVTYEVNLVPDASIEEVFDAWLDEHVAEMLNLPGFLTAVVRKSEEPDSGLVQRTVQYELRDRATLDDYFRDHAQRMRQQGLDRFGEQFKASRRILDHGHRVSRAGHMSACPNCESPLIGQYCAICGQRAKSRMITLWEMVREASDIIVSLDSKLWRTLSLLLFRPGRLTRDYLQGRRARYVAPLRLFIGLTLLFFFLIAIGQRFDIVDGVRVSTDLDDTPTESAELEEPGTNENNPVDGVDFRVHDDETDTAEDGDSASFNLQFGGSDEEEAAGDDAADPDEDDDSAAGQCEDIDLDIPESWTVVSAFLTEDRVREACQKTVADADGFARALIENLPAMMFFFLPLLAVFMKVTYLFTGRYFVEHLLFLVH